MDVLGLSGYLPSSTLPSVKLGDLALVGLNQDVCRREHTFDCMLSVGQRLDKFRLQASGILEATVPLLPLAAAVTAIIDTTLPIFVACFGRCIPCVEDMVIGVVTDKHGEEYSPAGVPARYPLLLRLQCAAGLLLPPRFDRRYEVIIITNAAQ
jgi:hypothetical protein